MTVGLYFVFHVHTHIPIPLVLKVYVDTCNLPHLLLKARHLSDSAFCTGSLRVEVSEQALSGIPLGLGLSVEDKPTDF